MTVFQILNDSSLFPVLYFLGKISRLDYSFQNIDKSLSIYSLSAKHAIVGNTPFKCSVRSKTQHSSLEQSTVNPLLHNSGTTNLPQIPHSHRECGGNHSTLPPKAQCICACARAHTHTEQGLTW